MNIKSTLTCPNFNFHLFDEDGKITIGLASKYVYPPVDRDDLQELVKFINDYLENE